MTLQMRTRDVAMGHSRCGRCRCGNCKIRAFVFNQKCKCLNIVFFVDPGKLFPDVATDASFFEIRWRLERRLSSIQIF